MYTACRRSSAAPPLPRKGAAGATSSGFGTAARCDTPSFPSWAASGPLKTPARNSEAAPISVARNPLPMLAWYWTSASSWARRRSRRTYGISHSHGVHSPGATLAIGLSEQFGPWSTQVSGWRQPLAVYPPWENMAPTNPATSVGSLVPLSRTHQNPSLDAATSLAPAPHCHVHTLPAMSSCPSSKHPASFVPESAALLPRGTARRRRAVSVGVPFLGRCRVHPR
mmetsp:Transcript_94902/g.268674  ORF Transcript_94902/g.268674 Transcript_94902/m.268674 type:complete len:225 (+) Transcript_94902:599-1273(+)